MRSQKTKRVSWASDLSLCQVRLFLSEKAPTHVLGTDNLKEKEAADNEDEESFPPGFGEIQPENMWRIKVSEIPLIKWKSPRRFDVKNEWQVVAGEESIEVEAQSQREMSVLEAIYPRPSSIPPNPFGLLNVEASTAMDISTPPVVPITPIEEEDALTPISQPQVSLNVEASTAKDISTPPVVPITPIEEEDALTPISHPQDLNAVFTSISQPQVSNASFTSISSSFGQGNLVDREIIKILNTPKMTEKLVSSHNISSSTQNGTFAAIQNRPFNGTQYIPFNLRPLTHNAHMIRPTPNGHFYPAATQVRPPAYPPMRKDINYFKSLIQQHGRERNDGFLVSSGQSLNPVSFGVLKQRILKPCIYFNSPTGCRNGVNCTYQHDVSSGNGVHGFPGVHNAKRLKLDCEITDR